MSIEDSASLLDDLSSLQELGDIMSISKIRHKGFACKLFVRQA